MAGRGHDHDDAAARAPLHHEAGDVLGAEKGAGEVHRELARPALERHVEHAVAAEDAGVVHQHVHGTVGRARLHDHRLHLALVGDVAHEAEGLPAAPPDRLRALLRVVGGHVHADDARSLVRSSPPLAFLALFSTYRFPVLDRANAGGAPVLVMHGTADSVIPFELGRALYDGLIGKKTFVEIAGGDHNDARPPDERAYWRAVDDFIAATRSPWP